MILHENCLPADDSHEISWFFLKKKQQNLLQIIGGALWVNIWASARDLVLIASMSSKNCNGVARTLKQVRISKGDYRTKQ